MKVKRNIASFVLRFTQEFWQDPQGEPRVEWRGHICHVQDGDECRFTELTDVMNFIQQSLLKLTLGCVPPDDKMVQDKALRESFKLWEKFASGYSERLAGALQQTAPQNEITAILDPAQMLQTVVALQGQIAFLTTKVSKLEAELATQAQHTQS